MKTFYTDNHALAELLNDNGFNLKCDTDKNESIISDKKADEIEEFILENAPGAIGDAIIEDFTIVDYADEKGLDVVEITKGRNGYPQGLYKAVAGFDNFDEAELAASDLSGSIVLLARRDGHQLWSNLGRTYAAIEIDEQWISNDDSLYYYNGEHGWKRDFMDRLQGEIDALQDLSELSELARRAEVVYDALQYMDDADVFVLNDYAFWNNPQYPAKGSDLFSIEPRFTMHRHDDDVTDYMIAVVVEE